MKIGFSFFGIIQGSGEITNKSRDALHCWPNIQKMLIDPFKNQGHECKIYISSYETFDKTTGEKFINLSNPEKIYYSDYNNSDSFTTKYAAFDNFENEDLDTIVFTRLDIHFNSSMINENISFDKFNFLFKEKDWWNSHKFTCDNFYIWPQRFTSKVKTALKESYKAYRKYSDTHGLYEKLTQYIPESEINFISDQHQLSDINSYYTVCRPYLPTDGRGQNMHPEVRERWYK